MKTKITFVAVAASLTIGFLAGKIQTVSWYKEKVFKPYIYQRDAYSAGCYTQVLTVLRSGHEEDAASALEQYLNLSLLSLEHLPVKQATDLTRGAILQARDYRARHPWDKTSPEIESRIQKVLTSVQ